MRTQLHFLLRPTHTWTDIQVKSTVTTINHPNSRVSWVLPFLSMKSCCYYILFHFFGIKLMPLAHITILYETKDKNITEKHNLFEYLFTNQVLPCVVRGYATFSQRSKIIGFSCLESSIETNPTRSTAMQLLIYQVARQNKKREERHILLGIIFCLFCSG